MNRGGLLPVALFCVVSSAWAGERLGDTGDVSAQPREVFQGGIVKLTVSREGWQGVHGLLRQRRIPFFPDGDGGWVSWLGVDLEEKPGRLEIALRAEGKDRQKQGTSIVVRVRKKAFPEEQLTVAESFDRPDQATLKRIEREQEALNRLWAAVTSRQLWEGSFVLPVAGGVSSPFGLRRIVNGVRRSPHGGLDLKASLGTEVRAANHGQAVLRDEFFFSGKSLVLDHGGGLYTMYFHLSDFAVARGAHIRKGEVIGRAGMSGRATGPHLHWGTRLNGARVDPLALVDLVGEGNVR